MDPRRSSFCFTLFCLVGSGTVPVHLSPYRVPYLVSDMQVGSQQLASLRNMVHLGTQTLLVTNRAFPRRMITRSPELIMSASTHVVLRRHGIRSALHFIDERQLLAIGPGSDVWRTFGNVGFVHSTNGSASLVLGLTEDDFVTRSCLPGSVIRVPTFENQGYPSFSFTTGTLLSEIVNVRFSSIDRILLLPVRVWRAFFYHIPSIMNDGVFHNCSQNRNRLPEIHLSLEAGHQIILTPDDYLRIRAEEMDVCDVLIQPTPYPEGRHEDMVEFNPLLIPGFNSFTAQNFLIICESLQYTE